MEDQWYYQVDGEALGPVSFRKLCQRVRAGVIAPTNRIRCGLEGDWVKASSIPGLFHVLPQTTSSLSFEQMLRGSRNQIGLSILTLLAWIAASDGRVSDEEMAILRQIAASGRNAEELLEAIRFAQAGNAEDLRTACLVCRTSTNEETQRLLLQMAIGVAIADGYLAVSENHILRFLADLFAVSPQDMNSLFSDATNRPFPVPGDVSTAQWWNGREKMSTERSETCNCNEDQQSKGAPEDARPETKPMTRLRAFAILGLEECASSQEIHETYRRLSKVHHPDRFTQLGPEAEKAATATFVRIQEAFETLVPS